MKKQKWIWEYEEYPNFKYDKDRLSLILRDIAYEQGKLKAFMLLMDQESTKYSLASTLENEIIASCQIEGEILNRQSVRSSIKQKLGLESHEHYNAIRKEANYVEILIDVNTHYNEALNLEKIFGWHHAMFEKGYSGFSKIKVAQFRGIGSMQVVSGDYGKEKIHYEAPPFDTLEQEMNSFIQWFNETPSSLEKAAITHLWFVIIHPFDDGNGRIARAITDLVLSKIENSKISRLYSMSSAINDDRKGYYKALEYTTGYIKKEDNFLDITFWCEWFLQTLYKALIDAKDRLNFIIIKTKFWDKNRDKNLNSRQIKVLNFILDIGIDNFKGNLTKKKYMSISNSSSTTASRDLAQLIELNCIKQIEGTAGRNISYEINI